MRLIFYKLLILLVLVSCGKSESSQENTDLMPKALGGFSEITVVVKESLWKKGLDTIANSVFSKNIKGLYAPESNFDLINVKPKGFSSLFKRQRIVLSIQVNKTRSKEGVGFKRDKFAKGQLYILVQSTTEEGVRKLLFDNANLLLSAVEKHRTDKSIDRLARSVKPSIKKKINNLFSARVLLPNSYQLVSEESKLLYFGKQAKALCQSGRNTECHYQMGYMIHEFPYVDANTFKESYFKALRDSLTKIHIVGSKDSSNSYMEIESTFPLDITPVQIDSCVGIQVKGWWNMVNATMGGPFVSYLVLNEENQQMYFLDGFMFGPNFRKRDFMLEVQAISKSLQLKK